MFSHSQTPLSLLARPSQLVRQQEEASSTGGRTSGLETKVTKARAKLEQAKEKVESVERAPLPKVEVGVI